MAVKRRRLALFLATAVMCCAMMTIWHGHAVLAVVHADQENIVQEERLGRDAQEVATNGGTEVEHGADDGQSERHFTPSPEHRTSIDHSLRARIRSTIPKAHWGPMEVAEEYRDLRKLTGCDPFTVDFGDRLDARCVAYMSNISNWQLVKPMSSILMTQRTIKFKVTMLQKGIIAILKVPQRKFILEPFSEYTAWAVDHLLELNYVPPTAWVAVPLSLLKEAVQKNNDKKYSQWLDDALFAFIHERGLVKQNSDGQETIGCSVQLWIHGVHDLRDTIYALPYRHLDTTWWRLFEPERNHNLSSELTISVHHCSDLVTFDFICDNDDRSPNKNNYAAGGCRRCRPDRMPHRGPPEFVHLDQGSGFYHGGSGFTERNALQHRDTVDYCTFRRPLLQQLRRWATQSGKGTKPFYQALRNRVPEDIVQTIGKPSLSSTQYRLDIALKQAEKCIAKYGEAQVVPG